MTVASDSMLDGALSEVSTCFWRYETALMAGDRAVLDELFLDDPATMRADPAGVLVGADAIRAFRSSRRGAPARIVDRLHLRQISDTAAVALAELRRADGGRGLQTQLWVRTPVGWRVSVAHVSDSPADVDPIWRLRGTPLVSGAPDGPLHGLSIAVKDLFAVAGYRRGAGVPAWLAEAPVENRHSAAVQSLLDAGADVLGIAQTDQLAFSLAGTNAAYGTPPNPAVAGGIPGGSSSGPASAVSTGQADIGLGTDTGGSVRVPASYQGLFGIRPTHGAVSTDSLIPLAPRFDTVGWLTRDAGILRRVGDVLLAGGDAPAVSNAVLAQDLLELADADVADAVERAALRLADLAGLELTVVREVTGASIDAWVNTFRTLQMAQAHRAHGKWIRAHPGALADDVAGRFDDAAKVTVEDEQAVEPVAMEVRRRVLTVLSPGTVLLLPASSTAAPPRRQDPQAAAATRLGTLRLTCLSGLSGAPAVVMPTRTATGRPVGLCALGAAGSDRALLALAQRWKDYP